MKYNKLIINTNFWACQVLASLLSEKLKALEKLSETLPRPNGKAGRANGVRLIVFACYPSHTAMFYAVSKIDNEAEDKPGDKPRPVKYA